MRTRVYGFLRETADNGHFPNTAVIDGFLNEGAEFLAVFIEYPRDLGWFTAVAGTPDYANPSDNLLLRTCYFGDENVPGDIRPIKFVTEETLKEIYPSWLDQTVASAGRPQYIIQKDRHTMSVYPIPDSLNAGKKIWLNYNYVPTPMTNDSDNPDIPAPYHTLLPQYALHLAYITINKEDVAGARYKDFMQKVNAIKSAVTKESKETLGFSWGYTDVNVDTGILGTGGINFP